MQRGNLLVIGLFVAFGSRTASIGAQTPTPPIGISPPQLAGLWVLTSDPVVAGRKVEEPVHRVRAFTNTEWYYAQSSPAKNSVDFLYGGTYRVGGLYRQDVAYVSAGAMEMLTHSDVFQIKLDGDTLTITGKHGLTGSSSTDSTEVWRRVPASGLSAEEQARVMPSEAERKEIGLLQGALSASPQNLAGAYLNNHDRLATIAMVQKGDLKNVNLFIGTEKVTPENAAKLAAEFQHREDVYVAEAKRRGTMPIGGSYRLTTAAPCTDPPVDLELKQDGFAIEIRKPGATGEHVLSGAVVHGVLTVGDGDFSADTYAFGKIGADGTIELKAFSGQGCSMTLTKK